MVHNNDIGPCPLRDFVEVLVEGVQIEQSIQSNLFLAFRRSF